MRGQHRCRKLGCSPNLGSGIRQAPRALIEGLQCVAAGGGQTDGNLTGRTAGSETAVDPMIVAMTEEARAHFQALSTEITAELRAAAGTPYTSILARVAENARKLALIVAVGRDPRAPSICLQDAVWSTDLVRHHARRTIEAVERHVADTETEANVKRLREIIRRAGAEGIAKSEITRASQWIRARDRDEILLTLIESGDVTTVQRQTGGRKVMLFRALR